MGRTWLPALLIPFVLGALALSLAPRGATATELLANAGFESWAAGVPASWHVDGGPASEEAANTVDGKAVRVSGPDIVGVWQRVQVQEGALYEASVHVAGDPGTRARLKLAFEDGGFSQAGMPYTSQDTAVGSSYASRLVAAVAPAGAEWVVFVIEFLPGGGATVEGLADQASLIMAAAPEPTATPEPTSTPTGPAATATEPGESPTGVPSTSNTAQASPAGTSTAGASATKSATATRTATAPSGGGGSGGVKIGTPTKTPTPLPTSTPTRPAGQSAGDSTWELVNGGFELAAEGKPHYWSKYGGEIGLEGAAFEGSYAATLTSETTSTKWLYQAVRVRPGAWYRSTAMGRMSVGSGEVFLRLTWYESEDGSGTAIDSADSETAPGRNWALLSVTARAPAGANSVRVRLMLRPGGHCMAAFDAVELAETAPQGPEATLTPTATATVANPATAGAPSPTRGTFAQEGGPAGGRVAGAVSGSPGAMPVRISEIMSDPPEPGRDSAYEWVELVNAGVEAVDLGGWRIGDANSLDTLPAYILGAGSYVVVAGKSAGLPASIVVLRVVDGEIGSGLNNTGDRVRLLGPDSEAVDTISYGDDTTVFEPPPPAPGTGKTIGVLDPAANRSEMNWALTDRPSPGEPNVFGAQTVHTGTETVSPRGEGASATPGTAAAGAAVDVERGNGSSAVPWVLLGGMAGVGLFGLGSLARRAAPGIWPRSKRDD
ncbi:hypothetical protein EDM76_10530 [bacterium]|nr:MAG: hypothetical protein EDM76_10530 [bacterium]